MSYLSSVLADAPRHYWRLADPGGVYAHDIGSVPIALDVNGVSPWLMPYSGPSSDGGSAFLGSAYVWDTDGEVIAAPVTVECIVWQQSRSGAFQVALQVNTIGANLVQLGINSTGHPQVNVQLGALTAPAAISRQHWHHLVATVTAAGVVALYVDAISVATGSPGIAGSNTYLYAVGGVTNNFGNAFFGNIAEAAVYNTALTPARVTAHFVALDAIASRPIFAQNGSFDVTTGTGTTGGAELAAILASVRQSFS